MTSRGLASTPIQLLVLAFLVLGLIFRFANLDGKVYWIDEVHSSMRLAGYGKTEVVDRLTETVAVGDGGADAPRLLAPEDLLESQRPEGNRSLLQAWGDTIRVLAEDNPQHPPLYYLAAQTTSWIFGQSPAAVRGTSALLSLLAFPALYWLCLELFELPEVGGAAVCLLAVSPFHVLYAQEAREYSLLTVWILAASALLLRALAADSSSIYRAYPRQKWLGLGPVGRAWGGYGLLVALGLYTHLLFALVAIAHGCYVWIVSGLQWCRSVRAYAIATGAALLAFSPWIAAYVMHFDGMAWIDRPIGFGTLLKRWAIGWSSPFFDLQVAYPGQRLIDVEAGLDEAQVGILAALFVFLPVIALTLYSFVWMASQTHQSKWLFVVLLAIVPAGILMLPDAIGGGQRSTIGRFVIPTYLAFQIAIAHLIASKLMEPPRKLWRYQWRKTWTKVWRIEWQPVLWRVTVVVLAIAGIVSCGASLGADTWWNKYSSFYNPEVARILNEAERPLVVSGSEKAGRLTSLSYLAEPETRFLLVRKPAVPDLPGGYGTTFLFRPYAELREGLERAGYELTPRHPHVEFYEVTR